MKKTKAKPQSLRDQKDAGVLLLCLLSQLHFNSQSQRQKLLSLSLFCNSDENKKKSTEDAENE